MAKEHVSRCVSLVGLLWRLHGKQPRNCAKETALSAADVDGPLRAGGSINLDEAENER